MRNENNVTKISVWKHVTTNLDLFSCTTNITWLHH
jgi:hypothetical protein